MMLILLHKQEKREVQIMCMVNGLHLYSNLYSAAFLLASRSWVYRHHIKGKNMLKLIQKKG